ncbi:MULTISPECIES: maleylpyruvate isomerase family mycothiol-dependent enzyme [Streptomyces]|uniref:Maleylpyruvate isomerase family mycothiol-dependent enzyme n=1 Tax=Streptomyces cheonanensis TaxID=312720 RepID=A0ABN2UVY5_9ACTN
MTKPTADLTGLDEATHRLLTALDALDDAAIAAPSRLSGWTRGHLATHLARNADALVNVLAGRPMYPSEDSRDTDIDRGAPRPAAEQRADVRDSAQRLAGAFAALPADRWSTTAALRNGVTDRLDSLPLRRWVEVELHHIDLGIGRTVHDLPGAFTDRAVDYLTRRYEGHPALPPLDLRAEDGRSWYSGGHDGTRLVVAGAPTALVGWLSGRTTGSGLTVSGGTLPAAPAL